MVVDFENYPPSPEGAPDSLLPDPVLGRRKAQGETTVKDFRQLKVWQRAHQLTLEIYRTTASFPRSEAYALTPQIRRAAVSIPSNLAEGCGRKGDAELARFCNIASGSASELEYQILLARDLKLIKPEDYEILAQQTTEIKRMLTVFVQKLNAEC
jgi:four helix bundle protein